MIKISQKPRTHEQLFFAFELYQRIPKGRKVTAQMLQAELENAGISRDIRTIQRNLDIVVEYLDVDKDTRNKPYGYSRRFNSPNVLSGRELILIELAKASICHILPKSLHHLIFSAFEPLLELQQHTVSNKNHATQDKVIVTGLPSTLPTSIAHQHFESIITALYNQKELLIVANNHTLIDSRPLGILLQDSGLYLVYQTPQGEFESISFSDIQSVKVFTFHFDYPTGFKLSSFIIPKENVEPASS